MQRWSYIAYVIVLVISVNGCIESHPLAGFDSIDIHIKNGMIYEGNGSEPYIGHLYINGDSIVHVSNDEVAHVNIIKELDAQGKCVAPGFIDLHAHGDPLSTPNFFNFLAMGVTTIVLGQDGSSPMVDPLSQWMKKVDSSGIGVNLAMMVGHGTLRRMSDIGIDPEPDEDNLDKMKKLLDDHLEYCFGLSTGLEYTPGLYASSEELIGLAQITGKHDRIIMSHMRNEDDDQLESSIEELISQGEHCKVHVAHLKSVYGKGQERAEEILDIIHSARKRGIRITADVYPYTASYTGISILFPKWAKTKDQFDRILWTRRLELEDYLRNRVNKRNGPSATLLGSEPFKGKTLADLEEEMQQPFEKILIDEIGPGGSSGAYFVMNEALLSRLIMDDLVGVCSDGSPTGHHPRGHGTFAKIIEKYVVQDSILTLNDAIHKMTGYAASILDIKDRGTLQPGKKADVIIFSPDEIQALATYPDPYQLSEGFNDIIVNGNLVREAGQFSKALNGKVLYPN